MNSDELRTQRHYRSNFELPDFYPSIYTREGLWERIQTPNALIALGVLAVTIIYQLAAVTPNRTRLPPVSTLLWDLIVWIIPAFILHALDRLINPPLFPTTSMLPRQQATTHAAKSELFRKILGLDNPGGGAGGIMMSISNAGRRSLSAAGWPKGEPDQPPGLGNLDNSCYQNSILQGLASLKPLPAYLSTLSLQGYEERTSSRPPARTADTLRDLIATLTGTESNGRTLWTPGILKNMSTWQQQDAQEYYSKLLDEIDKEAGRAARELHKPAGFETDVARDETAASQHSDDSGYQSGASAPAASKAGSSMTGPAGSSSGVGGGVAEARALRNPLEGLLAQRVACMACGHSDGLSMIPFNCLTLSLGVGMEQHDLFEQLDSYTKVETIHGVECARCTLLKFRNLIVKIIERSRAAGMQDEDIPEPHRRLQAIEEALEEGDFDDKTLAVNCKIPSNQRVSSTKTKQAVIARPPQSLAIHMNRSVFDETTGRMFKNLGAVKFPLTLDLGPWCLGSAPNPEPESASSDGNGDGGKLESLADEEQWLLDPAASMVAGDLHPSKISGPIYELRAVVTHQGRHENGHYICYRKHPSVPKTETKDTVHEKGEAGAEQPPQLAAEGSRDEQAETADDKTGGNTTEQSSSPAPDADDSPLEPEQTPGEATEEQKPAPAEAPLEDQWWRLSDQDVREVSEEMVLAQGGVFMLFYDCVDHNAVLITEPESFVDSHSALGVAEAEEDGDTVKAEQFLPLLGEGSISKAASEHAQQEDEHETIQDALATPLPAAEDGL